MKASRIIVTILICVLAVMLGVCGCKKKATNTNSADTMAAYSDTTTKAAPATSEAFDQTFIDKVIKHHQDGIAAAQLAVTKAQHKELKKLAQDIVDKQTKEIKELQKWRNDWFPNAPMAEKTTTPAQGTSQTINMTELNNKTGMDFDKAFITMMIAHHQAGIAEMRTAETQATHSELKSKAKSMIDEQQKQIDDMTKWQGNWAAGKK